MSTKHGLGGGPASVWFVLSGLLWKHCSILGRGPALSVNAITKVTLYNKDNKNLIIS